MNLCLVLLLSSTAYDRLLRSPVSCAHLRVILHQAKLDVPHPLCCVVIGAQERGVLSSACIQG